VANKGIYSLNEFKSKEVLKLGPDSFVLVMGKDRARVLLSRVNSVETRTKELDFKSGLTGITSSAATQPGAGTCSISFVCPMYDSLNESYYLTQPNGVKIGFFQTMMEVRVYTKGRYLGKDGTPIYYPTFWGVVRTINESFNGNEAQITLSCRDTLSWWEDQIVNVVASPVQQRFGAPAVGHAGSIYRFMNPWEIILNLFKRTSFENFVFPSFSENGIPPLSLPYQVNDNGTDTGAYELIAGGIIKDWNDRYGFGSATKTDTNNGADPRFTSNLEMYGVSGALDISKSSQDFDLVEANKIAEKLAANARTSGVSVTGQDPGQEGSNNTAENSQQDVLEAETVSSKNTDPANQGDLVYMAKHLQQPGVGLSVQFDLIGEALPFANFEEYQVGNEPVRMTKLEMASYVAGSINFEFYQDPNGMFVFKPPFYNMDVSRNTIYTIKAEDIESMDIAEDSTNVVTYLEVTGPIIQTGKITPYVAYHVDFALMERFGIREKTVNLTFGSNPKSLRAMACSEMAKANSNVFSATITIACRPELRLGYPVYIEHMDVYYYIKGIQHSISFGSKASTTLTLSAKRERVYDDQGRLLKGYIYKAETEARDAKEQAKDVDRRYKAKDTQKNLEAEAISEVEKGTRKEASPNDVYSRESSALEKFAKTNNLISSPNPGFWNVVRSAAYTQLVESAAADATKETFTQQYANGTLTELVRYTDDTHPFTDVNGFQHIGGFPYGATLILGEDTTIKDSKSGQSTLAERIANITGEEERSEITTGSVDNREDTVATKVSEIE
jgi:hypothetical protein